MKKLFIILSIVLCFTANSATYYISSSGGNDGNSGTSTGSAWRTLSKFNTMWPSINPGDNVLLKRGDLFEGTITPPKSGTSGNPITIGDYGSGALPIVTSRHRIPTASWNSVGGNKYTSDALTTSSTVKFLYLDNKFRNKGRWPNADAANFGYLQYDVNTDYTITDNDWATISKPISNWSGGEIAFRQNRFRFSVYDVNQSGGTFTFPDKQVSTVNGFGYFLQNHIAALDRNGEWCYNKTTKQVSIYLDTDPSNHVIEVTLSDRVLYLNTRSFLTFNNIEFQGANDNAVEISGGINVIFNNCDVRHAWNTGIRASSADNLTINGGTIDSAMTFGFSGINNSDDNANIIDLEVRNTMPELGMGKTKNWQGSGINIEGDNFLVQYCKVVNSAYAGINANNGSHQHIYNDIVDGTCQRITDGGAFYTVNQIWQNDHTDKILRKCIFRNTDNGVGARGTFLNENLTMALYGDQWTTDWVWDQNTIIGGRVGIYFNDPFDNTVTNNTCYNYGATPGLSTVSGMQMSSVKVTGSTVTYNFFNPPVVVTAPAIHNNTVNGNVFFSSLTSAPKAVYLTKFSNSQSTQPLNYGTINNNFFVYPLTTAGATLFKAQTGGSGIGYKNTSYALSLWRSTMGYEGASNLSPKYYASVADAGVRFLVNETKNPITYSLTGDYVSAKNFSYSGSITLQPYTSEILLYGSGGVPPTDPPVDPPPPPPDPDPNPTPSPAGTIRVPTKYKIIHVNPLP